MKLKCTAVAFGFACAAFAARATVLEVNVPTGTEQTGFTAEQLSTIKTLTTADEIKKTGGGALLVNNTTTIGDFKGTLRLSNGCYVLQKGCLHYDSRKSPLGYTGEALVIVEAGATLYSDLYIQVKSNNFWGVKMRLNGAGYNNQGAFVLGGKWNGNTTYNGFYPVCDIVLDGPTTIAKGGDPGYFHTGSSLDMNGYDLTVVNDPGLKGVTSVTNPGKIVNGANQFDISPNGSILTEVNVAEGVVQTNLTAAQLAQIKASCWTDTRGGLLKTGPGALRVRKGYGLTGTIISEIRLSEGVYIMSYKDEAPFGKSPADCTVYVEDGATLFTDEYCNGSGYIDNLNLHLAGAGAPGIGGALVLGGNWDAGNTEWYGIYPYGWKVTLDADATVMRGYSNGYFGSSAGKRKTTIDMNGHTLTVNNTLRPINDPNEGFDFRGVELIENPGKIVVDGANQFRVAVTNWNGSEANELVLTNGASIAFDAVAVAPAWTLRLCGTGDLAVNASWKGPIVIDNGAANVKFAPTANAELQVSSDISGAGGVKVAGGNFSRTLLSGNNTYAGKTTLTGGSLVLMGKHALPDADADRIVGRASAADIDSVVAFAQQTETRTDGWTGEEMWELVKKFRYTADGGARNWGIGAYVDRGTDFDIPCDFANHTNFYQMTFQTFGGGRAVLRGDFPADRQVEPFRLEYGRGNANYFASNVVYAAQAEGGRTWIARTLSPAMTDITLENVYYYMGAWKYAYLMGRTGDYSKPQRLTVGPGACTDCVRASGGRALYACGDADDISAVVTLEEGGIISNNVWIASASRDLADTHHGQVGAYIQRGGAYRSFLPAVVDNGNTVGGSRKGLGYMEIDGGEYTIGVGNLTVGNWCNAYSVLRQMGGDIHVADGYWGRGGQAEMRFSGGTCRVDAIVAVPREGGVHGNTNGYASMVFDSGVRPQFPAGLALGSRIDGTGVVSFVSSAMLETPFVRRAAKTIANHANPNCVALANFNGGGVEATRDGAELLGSGDEAVDATVYADGAILSAQKDVTANVSASLKAPAGQSIVGLSYDAFPIRGAVASGYVIIRGDGVGATASAIYDSTKWEEKITGVEITSPGTGYTWAEAEIFRGSYVTNIPLTVTLGDAVTTGGVTKRGPGTIVLNAANTYGGDTVLEEGVLKLGAADALPSTSTIVCKGGAIDLNGQSPTGLVFDLTNLPFEKGAKYVLARNCGAGLPTFVGLPEGWATVNAGGRLKVREPTGIMVIVK